MNLSRGLFRFWLVAAVLWIGFFVRAMTPEFGCLFRLSECFYELPAAHIGGLAILTLAPPAAVLLIGCMVLWAFRKFRD